MIDFDFSNFVTVMLNNSLKENEDLKPIIKLLNKYGIYGEKAVSFLLEFNAILEQQSGGNNNEEK